jgi:hypothetical protein
MAAVTLLGTATFNTSSGTKTVTATPAVGDLIIIVTAHSGNTSSTAPTDNNPDGLGTYTQIATAAKASSADTLKMWARDAAIGNASSTVFTHAPGSSSGGGLAVHKVTGMSRFGASAAKQATTVNNQASGITGVSFGAAVLTGNALIGAIFNATNPAGLSTPSSWTERMDLGYSTPTTGLETASRDSGATAQTYQWSNSASAWCGVAVELDTTVPAVLVMQNATSAGSADAVTLAPKTALVNNDAVSAAPADNLTISSAHWALVVQNMTITRSFNRIIGFGRGPNLFTNGDFASGLTDWTAETGWSAGSGNAVATGATSVNELFQVFSDSSLIAAWRLTWDMTRSAGSLRAFHNFGGTVEGSEESTSGSKTFDLFASGGTGLLVPLGPSVSVGVGPDLAFTGTVDNMDLFATDAINLSLGAPLAINNGVSATEASNVTLGAQSPLNMAEAISASIASNITLAPKTALTVASGNSAAGTKGSANGPNLIVDPGFADPSKWTLGSGWSISAGQLIASGASGVVTANPSLNAPVPSNGPNPEYRLLLDYVTSLPSAGSVTVRHGNSTAYTISNSGITDANPRQVLAGEEYRLVASGLTGTFDNAQFYEINVLALQPKTGLIPAAAVSLSFTTSPALAPKTSLVPAGASSGSTASNITLAPKTSLAPAGATSASLASSVVLYTYIGILAQNAVSASLTSALTLNLRIMPANATSASIGDNVVLTPRWALALNNSVSATLASSPVLSFHDAVFPANAISATISTNIDLVQHSILTMQSGVSATLATSLAAPTLKYPLTVAAITTGTITTSPTLLPKTSLIVDSGTSISTSTNIEFTGITVQQAVSLSVAGSPLLGLSLIIANAFSAGILENIQLTPRWTLSSVGSVVCESQVDNITMSPEYILLQNLNATSLGEATNLNIGTWWELACGDLLSATIVTSPIPGVALDLEDGVSPSLGGHITLTNVKSVLNPATVRSQSNASSLTLFLSFTNYLKAPLTSIGAYNITNPGTVILRGDFFINAYVP